jgi:hypothetical protein
LLDELTPKIFFGISIKFIFEFEGLLEFEVCGGVDRIFFELELVFDIVDCDEVVGINVLVTGF